MKDIMNISKIALLILALNIFGCTDKFEEYNTDPYRPTKQTPMNHFPPMIASGFVVQINAAQYVEHMVGGVYGGYLSMSNAWGGNNFATYNPSPGWNDEPFRISFVEFYSNYYDVEAATEKKGHLYAMALLLKAHTMHRVVDTYGPIPYSKAKRGGDEIEYDSVEDVYKHMFEDLDYAIKTLTDFVSANNIKPLADLDQVYDGDYSKWVKYANSLKLRLAIRISGVAPEFAQQKAEEAVKHSIGCIESNSDNALYNMLAIENNRDYGICHIWDDTRANASIVTYMNAYNDPRISKYFEKSTAPEHTDDYVGLRSGIVGFEKSKVNEASNLVVGPKDALVIFRAAETAFLKAEGALLGWDMGGEAADLYKKGLSLSCQEWGVADMALFLEQGPVEDVTFNSIFGYGTYSFDQLAGVLWNDEASNEEKLKQLITQKWIANFPLGYEAWADHRRTGFPELIPVNSNLSQGQVDIERGIRRLTYPQSEYNGNEANVIKAVNEFLGGNDSQGTDIWWAKKN
ncbi:MAG: SusD/RagB family nutrient-binding outer membrane lipoprotein [Carboxylicivirga sp.]|jgi:hypothetical protein|nr:SusD/RagB family nutrient-binding outer membrane lipoprotein [Carboxylicivirga sp.]